MIKSGTLQSLTISHTVLKEGAKDIARAIVDRAMVDRTKKPRVTMRTITMEGCGYDRAGLKALIQARDIVRDTMKVYMNEYLEPGEEIMNAPFGIMSIPQLESGSTLSGWSLGSL